MLNRHLSCIIMVLLIGILFIPCRGSEKEFISSTEKEIDLFLKVGSKFSPFKLVEMGEEKENKILLPSLKIPSRGGQINSKLSPAVQRFLYEKCKEYGFEYELILALIEIESNFQQNLISKTNDYGLMQINKINHKWMEEVFNKKLDFFNPFDNIESGLFILSYYRNELKSFYGGKNLIKATLNSYNCGIGGWRRMGGPLNRKYSNSILKAKEKYKINFE